MGRSNKDRPFAAAVVEPAKLEEEIKKKTR